MISHSFETGPIRPPSEAQSLLLRVTRNCPWNRCRFCRTYQGKKFGRRTVSEVKSDIDAMKAIVDELNNLSEKMGLTGDPSSRVIEEVLCQAEDSRVQECIYHIAQWLGNGGNRVFLQDANSPILPTGELVDILTHLKGYFPAINRITTYARAHTLARAKKAGELAALKEAGLTRIHIGLESGSAEVLKLICKGVTPEEHITAGRKVMESGIELSEYFMPGLGGKDLSSEHATESARVVNAIKPHFIRLRTFTAVPGIGLAEDIKSSTFSPLSDDEAVIEIRLFIASLESPGSTVVSDHIINLLDEVEGELPRGKERMLAMIDAYLSLSGEERDLFKVGRRMGYFHCLADMDEPYLRSHAEAALQSITASGREIETVLRSLARRFI